MATNNDLTALLGNLGNVDASGCPAPFIGEALHPYKGGCKSMTNSEYEID
jgi:hypothetical protein